MTSQHRIGIDLGGTKIEARVLDAQGQEVMVKRIKSPRDNYHASLEAIAGLVRDVTPEGGATVGIGIPGALDSNSGLVKNANSTWLIGKPLKDDLKNVLSRDVRIANDANCFALSEARDGAASGANCVLGLILGTGAGAGLVIHGKILDGANRIAGEWGHNPLPAHIQREPDRICYCGRTNCIETFVCGPAISQDWDLRTGEQKTALDIAQLAKDGDEIALEVLVRYVERLSAAIATVVNILDPDVVVFGGGLSQLDGLPGAVQQAIVPHVFAAGGGMLNTKFVRNQWGDASGARGAAMLWDN